MKKLTPYYAYRIFVSYKQHFAGRIDITQYNNFFLRPSEKKFYEKNYYYIYKILTDNKIKTEDDWKAISIVSHLKDKNIFIKQILEEYNYFEKLANDWQSLQNSMSYNLEKDIRKLVRTMFREGITFDRNFPKWLLNIFTSHKITVETFGFLLRTLKINLDGDIDYEYIFKDPFERYIMLLDYDEQKIKSILEKTIKEERRYTM